VCDVFETDLPVASSNAAPMGLSERSIARYIRQARGGTARNAPFALRVARCNAKIARRAAIW